MTCKGMLRFWWGLKGKSHCWHSHQNTCTHCCLCKPEHVQWVDSSEHSRLCKLVRSQWGVTPASFTHCIWSWESKCKLHSLAEAAHSQGKGSVCLRRHMTASTQRLGAVVHGEWPLQLGKTGGMQFWSSFLLIILVLPHRHMSILLLLPLCSLGLTGLDSYLSKRLCCDSLKTHKAVGGSVHVWTMKLLLYVEVNRIKQLPI